MDPFSLDIPTEISSERLYFRRYHLDDSAMYFQMVRENWDHLYEFLPATLAAAKNEADVRAFIRWQNSEWDQHNVFIFGAWEKTAGTYIGEAYLANADWEVPRIEVGYFIVQSQTRKGYATEAARALTRLAFEKMQVLRVELQCRVDNGASRRVAERCGFTLEGRMRQQHRMKSGTLVDILWYGMLLEEWKKLV